MIAYFMLGRIVVGTLLLLSSLRIDSYEPMSTSFEMIWTYFPAKKFKTCFWF